MSTDARMLTPPEAAQRLGIHHQTLRRWIKAGDVKAIRMPSGRLRIDESEVNRILSGRAA